MPLPEACTRGPITLTSVGDSNARTSRTDSTPSPADPRDTSDGPPRLAPDSDALFLDVDGTLLQIAPHPDAVRVPPGLLPQLDRLAARTGGALALVSGRSIDDLDRLFAPLRLPCAGVHGLERRTAAAVVHRQDAAALLAPLRPPLVAFVRAHDGLLLEDKGQSLALHFRNAPDRACDAEALLRRLIADNGGALNLKGGKMVWEAVPASADKGTAIAAFMQEPPFAGRRPVFVGDDMTDEDGFAVVNAMGGVSIRVGRREVPTAARHRLRDEAAVFDWLRGAADAAARGAPR